MNKFTILHSYTKFPQDSVYINITNFALTFTTEFYKVEKCAFETQ